MNLDKIKTECKVIVEIINLIQNSSDKGEVNDLFIHLGNSIDELQEALKQ